MDVPESKGFSGRRYVQVEISHLSHYHRKEMYTLMDENCRCRDGCLVTSMSLDGTCSDLVKFAMIRRGNA